MRYLWVVAAFPLLVTGCSSIRFVTVDHNKLVTQDGAPVSIVGNPPVVCHYDNSSQTFSGYFMYETDDGVIVLDDFGRGIIELMNGPVCMFGYDNE
jgi:hypothetical protein